MTPYVGPRRRLASLHLLIPSISCPRSPGTSYSTPLLRIRQLQTWQGQRLGFCRFKYKTRFASPDSLRGKTNSLKTNLDSCILLYKCARTVCRTPLLPGQGKCCHTRHTFLLCKAHNHETDFLIPIPPQVLCAESLLQGPCSKAQQSR